MKQLYVIPNYKCNLSCSHCDLHLKEDNFNSELFYKNLKEFPADRKILFGGEPTYYLDRFEKCLEVGNIDSISTNLINFNTKIANDFVKYKLDIATSWNPTRFSIPQYLLWEKHLSYLAKIDLECIVLITLTPDLLEYPKGFLYPMFDSWNKIKSIKGVLFEPLLDENMPEDLHERADAWLCKLYKDWRWKFSNILKEKIIEGQICDCSEVYTLTPDGTIHKGCPQFNNFNIIEECLNCPLAGICKPCPLQKRCHFPKMLYRINTEK